MLKSKSKVMKSFQGLGKLTAKINQERVLAIEAWMGIGSGSVKRSKLSLVVQ
jgi:hypothetical protein